MGVFYSRAKIQVRVYVSRGSDSNDPVAVKMAFEDQWDVVQVQISQMCETAMEDRATLAGNLKDTHGEEVNEIIDALVENPDKDTFFLEWDLLAYEKIKKVLDTLVTEGSFQL